MSRIVDALKAAGEAMAEDMRPGHFSSNGRPMRCPYCGGDEFARCGLTLPQGIKLGINCTACGTYVVPPVPPERTGVAS